MSVLYRVGGTESGAPIIGLKFDKIIDCKDIQDLLENIYLDRVESSNTQINFSYESDISVILIKERSAIRQLKDLIMKFMPVLNLKVYCQDDWDNNLKLIKVELINERKICQFKPMRINHWMHHDHTCVHSTEMKNIDNGSNCKYNLYSMLKHWKHSTKNIENNKLTENDKDCSSNSIPSEISQINFKQILLKVDPSLNFNDDKFEMDLLSNWNFSALNLNSVQLIKCAYHLLNRLINKLGLTIDENDLLLLIFTIESSYHQINKFHNFNHAIDVMQATWRLCEIILPKLNSQSSFTNSKMINIDELCLLLCFAAIGHDIGHPGTNNSLFNKDSMTFELFGGSSILEKFHYNLFNNLLNKIWPELNMILTNNDLNLIEVAILATDMSLHTNYVNILTANEKTPENLKLNEIISLIIKAADISNVTRPLIISSKWAFLITLEFKDCSNLQKFFEISNDIAKESNEDLLNKQSCKLDRIEQYDSIIYQDIDIIKTYEMEVEMFDHIHSEKFSIDHLLSKYPMIPSGQLFFINTFAFEFFNKLNIVFPELNFLVQNINTNKEYWLSKQ